MKDTIKNLEKTIEDLRKQLGQARNEADRYNADRQKMVKTVFRLRALIRVLCQQLAKRTEELYKLREQQEERKDGSASA